MHKKILKNEITQIGEIPTGWLDGVFTHLKMDSFLQKSVEDGGPGKKPAYYSNDKLTGPVEQPLKKSSGQVLKRLPAGMPSIPSEVAY